MADSGAWKVDSAADLWQVFVQGAGLDVEGYDDQLLSELSENLKISSKDFARELDRSGITAETLLLHFLQLISPYAAMLQDILAFFARAGAQSSSENIRIRFEFDSVSDIFEFDLRNFKDWEARFHQVISRALEDEIDDLSALQLRHAFVVQGTTYQIDGSTWTNLTPPEVDIARWLVESQTNPATLIALPPPPTVFNSELRALLGRAWRFLSTSAFKGINDPEEHALSPDDIRTIIRGAYLLRTEEDSLLRRLREVFLGVQEIEVETTVIVEELIEIFNLPVWKRRSEFYSVWVGARLMTAFGEATRVHVVDQAIVFSFGGAHLATLPISREERFHVWCELRTQVSGVIGKGRKRAIQPDYVVLCEPVSHPDSAVLVVECKQYLQQSRRGFAEALIDYANGHRRAEVVLVNYGPTTSSVLERVAEKDTSLLTRTRLIGKLRPGSQTAIHEFEELVRDVAVRYGRGAELVTLPNEVPKSLRGTLRLSWLTDVDLDLHCWITDGQGERQHIHYANQLGELGGSRVELDQDVRSGGDVETLTWERADSVSLDFAIHAFSQGSDIGLAKPRVEVHVNDFVWIIQPPKGQLGTWWKLFRLEQVGSQICIWNSIDSEAPFAHGA